ncbi:MAG: HyaD/HybD family hydrogenase maturation endopeptidase [Deltaproteobacteria bacterium]|nr:HyaD/HybD family hydrogenase maturation endopeptidase [Deltaproteobacteria bacterium]
MPDKNQKKITVLGVGNILFADEGVGVRVMEALEDRYEFPENVSLVDGGVLGLNLLGTICDADELIVIDAVKNGEPPGTLHRLVGDEIPKRILAKNSIHQVDLLETLTACQMIDKVPETVIIGVEPEDIENLDLELTPIIREKVDDLVDMALNELKRLGVTVRPRIAGGASCA